MDSPLREVAFSQIHRRTNRRRNIVVSQFDANGVGGLATGLAWHYVLRTGEDGPWTALRSVPIALDASDDEVVQTVVRYLAAPGWYRDAVAAPKV